MINRNWVVKSLETKELYLVLDQIYEDYLIMKLTTGQMHKVKAFQLTNDFLFVRWANEEANR